MKIYSIYNYSETLSLSSFNRLDFNQLSSQHKRIAAIAVIAFALLALVAVTLWKCFREENLSVKKEAQQSSKTIPTPNDQAKKTEGKPPSTNENIEIIDVQESQKEVVNPIETKGNDLEEENTIKKPQEEIIVLPTEPDEDINNLNENASTLTREEKRNLMWKAFPDTNSRQLNICRFAFLKPDTVNQLLPVIIPSPYHSKLFSEHHLKELDISALENGQMRSFMWNAFPNPPSNPYEEDINRFALLKGKTVNQLLPFMLLSPYHLGLLSDNHLKELNTENLEDHQIQTLMLRLFPVHKSYEENKRRFDCLKPGPGITFPL